MKEILYKYKEIPMQKTRKYYTNIKVFLYKYEGNPIQI